LKPDRFFVSAVIPVYDGEEFLAEAVGSIQRQGYSPLEIIIVDDGSTDRTAKIAASLKGDVHYVRQSNSGPAVARNKALKIARGNVIAFQDVDDLWSENKLELQLACLADNPSVEIVLGHSQPMQLTGVVNGKHTFAEFADPWVALHLGSAIFRKSVFDKVGLFDETLRYCDDWDWFMRARELGISMVIQQEVTHFFRRHKHNLTNQKTLDDYHTNDRIEHLKMLKKSLDRRRKQNNGIAPILPKLDLP
jgi:glycosyltransferase involved in cell wall biosynthesis